MLDGVDGHTLLGRTAKTEAFCCLKDGAAVLECVYSFLCSGHGFHNEENRFEFYEAMEGFLAKHIGQKNVSAN
jgi:hypothetical protein